MSAVVSKNTREVCLMHYTVVRRHSFGVDGVSAPLTELLKMGKHSRFQHTGKRFAIS